VVLKGGVSLQARDGSASVGSDSNFDFAYLWSSTTDNFDVSDPSLVSTSASYRNLVLKKGALTPGFAYGFRLDVTATAGMDRLVCMCVCVCVHVSVNV
jgi:hypothetical protein